MFIVFSPPIPMCARVKIHLYITLGAGCAGSTVLRGGGDRVRRVCRPQHLRITRNCWRVNHKLFISIIRMVPENRDLRCVSRPGTLRSRRCMVGTPSTKGAVWLGPPAPKALGAKTHLESRVCN